MNLSVGIVGLPNVGKSTLFNALLKKQAALAANYPFATVEPNVGIVEVQDERLERLAETIGKNKGDPSQPPLEKGRSTLPPVVPATIQFVDIAGLVKGAAEGEGLGNKFLANIRETDLICHVLRAFRDEDVTVTGKMNPQEDLEIVRTELILKDLETIERQLKVKSEKLNVVVKNLKIYQAAIEKLQAGLSQGQMANQILDSEELNEVKHLSLLTAKPEVIVLNVGEEDLIRRSATPGVKSSETPGVAERIPLPTISICAKVEAELTELNENEQKEYLQELGLHESGIDKLAKAAYQTLGLVSFLTAGEKECRAWTVRNGTNAQNASGVIHQDFIKNFIKAKVCNFEDFISFNGWKGAAEAGKVRMEGKEYIIQDGDVVEFMIGK